MTFSTQQIKKLSARIRPQHIREREVEGRTLHYIEGWHAIAEANRIFGFDAWDRETVSSQCVWQKPVEGRYGAAYVTKIRLTVRAGASTIVREGFGAGEATAPTPGQAHERAAKAAETDATKRALSTFGNSFGLSLYRGKPEAAKGQIGRRSQVARRIEADAPHMGRAEPRSPPTPAAVTRRIAARVHSEPGAAKDAAPYQRVETQPSASAPEDQGFAAPNRPSERIPIDKSLLPFGEPKRHRDPDHLRFVARQPCLVCGRTPTQAHHLRYTQPRAVGRKVSDEFVVPLCPFHHDEVHRTGNEYNWWRARGIDAVSIAYALWDASRQGGDSGDLRETSPEPRPQPRIMGSQEQSGAVARTSASIASVSDDPRTAADGEAVSAQADDTAAAHDPISIDRGP